MVERDPHIHLFDRARRRKIRGRASGESHFLAAWTAAQLADRLGDIKRDFPLAVTMGANPPEAPDKIARRFHMDLAGEADVAGDEEFLPLKPAGLDLVMSNLSLHAVNDLPGALIQIRRALRPDGLFLAAMFGGETLHELRESLMQAELELKGGVSPRIFPFADKPQAGALLQRAGFALPVIDSEILTVTYDDAFALMRDLRLIGESNIIAGRSRTNPGKALFQKAAEYYRAKFADPAGRVTASFEIVFMIGWAPHENQQKPLKPGSAAIRLEDVLKNN